MSQTHEGRLPAAYLRAGSASFAEFLGEHAPTLLPGGRPVAEPAARAEVAAVRQEVADMAAALAQPAGRGRQ